MVGDQHGVCDVFFFNDTATTEIYTLSLHDALPISDAGVGRTESVVAARALRDLEEEAVLERKGVGVPECAAAAGRSEEHTSELQSRQYLVCRLLLEKKKSCRLIYYCGLPAGILRCL